MATAPLLPTRLPRPVFTVDTATSLSGGEGKGGGVEEGRGVGWRREGGGVEEGRGMGWRREGR